MSVQLGESFQDLIDEPEKRFQEFFSFYCDKALTLSPGLKIRQYLRSGQVLIQTGDVYFNERDYYQAFVCYSRYALLFWEKLPKHPQYSQISPTELSVIKNQIKTYMPRIEKLKLLIKEQYAKEAREHALRKQQEQDASNRQAATSGQHQRDDHGGALRDKYTSENEQEYEKILAGQRDINSANSSSSSHRPSAPSAPVVDRSLKPGTTTSLTNVHNFRIVNLPGDTSAKFLELAEINTRRNVETCGILAGQLAQNKFHITHCIIPKQSGTSETCSTEEEHELFDAIDSNNLITLGWIHTHPSQTAFLSSVDLHTHFGYQVMIPEAIAIVCAPTYNQTGIFILNPEFGMREVSECSQSGFHPHTTQPPLFQDCDHVSLDERARIKIIDLRMKSSY